MATREFAADKIIPDYSDSLVHESVDRGVMPDQFNYFTLAGAIGAIVVITIVLMIGMSEYFSYYRSHLAEKNALNVEYKDLNAQRERDYYQLNTGKPSKQSGGTYRVNINDAMKIVSAGQ